MKAAFLSCFRCAMRKPNALYRQGYQAVLCNACLAKLEPAKKYEEELMTEMIALLERVASTGYFITEISAVLAKVKRRV